MGRFIAKCVVSSIVIVPLLMWFTEATFWGALLAAVALCVISYFLGDLWILPASNNTIATLTDAALALAWFWVVADYADWSLSSAELLTLVIAVAVIEAVFHRMIATGGRKYAAN